MADAVLERLLDPGRSVQPAWMPQPDDLASWGRELWQTEIPEELRQTYGGLRDESDLTLLIVSTDPSYPWELAKPYQGREMDDDFWASKFRLAHRLAGSNCRVK